MDASLAMSQPEPTNASGWTPAVTDGFSPRISTALANARYGFFVRSMAHGAASACSPRITAPARVARSAGAYLLFAKNVSSDGSGSLDTRHARDVEFTVPFEPAAEALRKSVKLHIRYVLLRTIR